MGEEGSVSGLSHLFYLEAILTRSQAEGQVLTGSPGVSVSPVWMDGGSGALDN